MRSCNPHLTLAALLLVTGYCYSDQNVAQSLAAGYTAPAGIDVGRSWECYLEGDFIFWETMQENTELGVVALPGSSESTIKGSFIDNDFKYKPGFKVALGFGTNHDGWDTQIEYTWFQSTHTTTKTLPSGSTLVIYPVWLSPQGGTFKSASEKWKLGLNCVDWTVGRSSQFGEKTTLQPTFGLRGLWLDQEADLAYNQRSGTTTNIFLEARSYSWAVGPELGVASNWLIGSGFKLFGNIEADVLYTHYFDLSEKEIVYSPTQTITRRDIKQSHLNLLRPHCDLELGVAWGSYFAKHSAHIDIGLGYGFQVFWNQNMFRKFVDDTEWCSSLSSNGNLYIQGLTASARFDF